jgi:Domain of Unknown Function (DUF1206)
MPEKKAFDLIARIGLVCYAVVHLLVAWLAAQVALGDAEKADKAGALHVVANGGGAWLLWVVTVGLGVLALWQLSEAIAGHRHADPRRRVIRRVLSGIEVVLYGLVAYSAAKIASSGADDGQSSLVAIVLAEPYGEFLVMLIGIVVVGVAGFLAYRGIRKRFLHELDFGSATPAIRRSTTRLGQVGWVGVSSAYAAVGVMFILSAARYDPGKASGLDVALKTIAVQPYGQWLLLLLAAGIAAFGVFALFDARFRRI